MIEGIIYSKPAERKLNKYIRKAKNLYHVPSKLKWHLPFHFVQQTFTWCCFYHEVGRCYCHQLKVEFKITNNRALCNLLFTECTITINRGNILAAKLNSSKTLLQKVNLVNPCTSLAFVPVRTVIQMFQKVWQDSLKKTCDRVLF